MIDRTSLVLLTLFVAACSSSVDAPATGGDAAADVPIFDEPHRESGAGEGDGAHPDDAQAETSGGDAIASADGGGFTGASCAAACTRAASCGWAMPFGCSDWCGPSSFTPHLDCIAASKTCDEACACMGWSTCPTPRDGGAD